MTIAQRRFALWQAFVTGYLTLAAASVWTDIVGDRVAGLLLAIGAALNAGTGAFVAALSPEPRPQPPAQEIHLDVRER